MITEEANKIAQAIQNEFTTMTVAVQTPLNDPDNALITVRGAGFNFLPVELSRLLDYARDCEPMVYADESGLFFMFH